MRRQAASQLTEWELTHLAETACLLLSELLTNAVKASSSKTERVTAQLSCNESTLKVAVSDTADERPQLSVPPLEQEGGRGLLIVTMLSKEWGTRPNATGPGKTVWCTLTLPPSNSGPHTAQARDDARPVSDFGLSQAVSRLAHLRVRNHAPPVHARVGLPRPAERTASADRRSA
ncbi:ATP-binding protein [Streptomyces roseirectus]|uniref:ATP-binding protein n=1 Tax=Streptomyces roseirectus TaxID=2768066 RepID=UPI003CCD2EA4